MSGYRPAPAERLRAARDSGPRKASAIRHVVLHSTEGGTAKSVAEMFHADDAKASTHLVIDDSETYICVPELVIPWGAKGVNLSGLHIEHCGWARWKTEEWMTHRRMLDQSARRAALWSWSYNIPTVILSPLGLEQGRAGFVTHLTATRAFHTPGGHTDPGSGFPLGLYMSAVREYRQLIEQDRSRP